ncbi:MAG: hypothetical protein EHM60_11655 [Lysobacterales bacterium]|nr:MAG: hypothetical protein EHM60_11655 [Xanthomonadales bacterium]
MSPPLQRPFLSAPRVEVSARFERAVVERDAVAAAHCIHELWMRHEPPMIVEALLERLWAAAAASVPEWLPMRYVEWLPLAYDVAARFEAGRRGRSNLYLVLLDYADGARGPYGVYVGATKYSPAERFDQHKAGIRAAGSVLKRGLEVLTGPVLHLQGITAARAAEVEERLAEALAAEGLIVQGGH